jgi:hypothetical protein
LNRKSVGSAEQLAFQLLGVLFQIAGPILLISGIFLMAVEVSEGLALGPSDLGVVCLTLGVALILMGGLLAENVETDTEEGLLRWEADLSEYSSRVKPRASSGSLDAHQCPSCGYSNKSATFFCDACNSPIWPKGTPTGHPLDHAVVEKRKRMVIARGKAVRIVAITMIIIVATAPIWTFAVTGYWAVNSAQLSIDYKWLNNPQSGTAVISAVVSVQGVPVRGELMNPSFTLSAAGVVVTRLVCPNKTILAGSNNFVCTVFTLVVTQRLTKLELSMEGVLRLGLYQDFITRTASLQL